jgi:transcriptional regulator with XRE-family HTH domain
MLFRMVAYMERQQKRLAKTATRGKAATRGGRAVRYFGRRLRAERERRGWTQVELAERLADAGWPVNPTVLAKVESANEGVQRSLKVDEALAVAEVFEMSLDSLLGRATDAESSDELELILRTAIDTARSLAGHLAQIRATFHDRFVEVEALDFTGREQLQAHVEAARSALDHASHALAVIAVFSVPDNNFQIALRRPPDNDFQVVQRRPPDNDFQVVQRQPQFGSTGDLKSEEQ